VRSKKPVYWHKRSTARARKKPVNACFREYRKPLKRSFLRRNGENPASSSQEVL
jgi:hypothetical protein